MLVFDRARSTKRPKTWYSNNYIRGLCLGVESLNANSILEIPVTKLYTEMTCGVWIVEAVVYRTKKA